MKTAMTDEEKRIAIAEYLGWKLHETGIWIPPSSKLADAGLPDFLNSLDAMYEAEEKLTKEQRETYIRALHFYETGAKFRSTWEADWLILHATARQRAEAFLKTVQQP